MKKSRTTEEWQALIERYYDGLTSTDEERELSEYLFSADQQANAATNADRAVMAYMAAGKRLTEQRRHRTIGFRPMLAAASVAAIVAFAAYSIHKTAAPNNWASIDGTVYYSENIARNQMEQNLDAMLAGYTTVEDELSIIFAE